MSAKEGQVHGLSLYISQFWKTREALFQSITLWHQTWGATPVMNISFQERETSLRQSKHSSRTPAQPLAYYPDVQGQLLLQKIKCFIFEIKPLCLYCFINFLL